MGFLPSFPKLAHRCLAGSGYSDCMRIAARLYGGIDARGLSPHFGPLVHAAAPQIRMRLSLPATEKRIQNDAAPDASTRSVNLSIPSILCSVALPFLGLAALIARSLAAIVLDAIVPPM